MGERAFPANRKEIKRLRIKKGWSQEQLATKAAVSKGTIENLEKGANAYLRIFSKVATAFNVSTESLIDGYTPTHEVTPGQITVQVTVAISYRDFDQSAKLCEFIQHLKHLINGGDSIEVTDISEGSVIITLSMSETDVEKLIRAFLEGELAADNILHVKVHERTLPRDLAKAILLSLLKAVSKEFDFTTKRAYEVLAAEGERIRDMALAMLVHYDDMRFGGNRLSDLLDDHRSHLSARGESDAHQQDDPT